MARSTDDHCLALACRHHLDPRMLFTARVVLVVFQSPYVVYFDVLRTPTVLTSIHQESLFEFCPSSEYTLWLVVEDCLHVPFQRAASPLRDEGCLSFPFPDDSQHLVGTLVYQDSRLVPVVHFTHCHLELVCQRLRQGHFHDPGEVALLWPV